MVLSEVVPMPARKMKTMAEKRAELMQNPEYRAAYDALEEEFNLARVLIQARKRAGLTQAALAEKLQTTQSSIARMESGHSLPAMATLMKFAKATGQRLEITFKPLQA